MVSELIKRTHGGGVWRVQHVNVDSPFFWEIGVTVARQDLALKEEFRLLYLLPS